MVAKAPCSKPLIASKSNQSAIGSAISRLDAQNRVYGASYPTRTDAGQHSRLTFSQVARFKPPLSSVDLHSISHHMAVFVHSSSISWTQTIVGIQYVYETCTLSVPNAPCLKPLVAGTVPGVHQVVVEFRERLVSHACVGS